MVPRLFCAGAMALLAVAAAKAAEPAVSTPASVSVPAYGISFVPPAGWVADPCPRAPYIALYEQVEPATHQVVAQITIDSAETPPFERSKLDEFAIRQNAKVLDQKFEIDHLPAAAVMKEQRDSVSAPFLILIAKREKRSYTFRVISNSSKPMTHDLIALVKSVRWIPATNPLDSMQEMQQLHLFEERASITLPTLFRQWPQELPKNTARYVILDPDGRRVAAILFSFTPAGGDVQGIPDDDHIDTVRRNMLESAQRAWGMSDYPLLEAKKPLRNGLCTTLTKITQMGQDARVLTSYDRFCEVFDEVGLTTVIFECYAPDDDAALKWDGVMIKVVNSLQFAPRAATQAGSAAATRPTP